MNTDYFNTQREISKIRIDTIKGTMKGYAKAKELKSQSPRVFTRPYSEATSENITSFTSVTPYNPHSIGDESLGGGLF